MRVSLDLWWRSAGRSRLIVAVLALGLGGALAGAKKKHKKRHVWGSKVTLAHPSPTQFAGSGRLEPGGLLQGAPGDRLLHGPEQRKHGAALGSADGRQGPLRVDLTHAAFAGSYQAQAAKERIRARKKRQTCRVADSPILGI